MKEEEKSTFMKRQSSWKKLKTKLESAGTESKDSDNPNLQLITLYTS